MFSSCVFDGSRRKFVQRLERALEIHVVVLELAGKDAVVCIRQM